jgi:hypothetical protein
VDLGKEWGTELLAYGVLTQRRVTMLRPTKGMCHPSSPPSLTDAPLKGGASDGGSEGTTRRTS